MSIMNYIKSIQERDPAQPTVCEVIFSYPSFHQMVIFHPLAHLLWGYNLRALARFWAHIGRLLTGVEIHPAAKIGRNFFIDHGTGVVIGQTATIGDNCVIFQGVSLGGRSDKKNEKGYRHPQLGNDVTIGVSAVLLGPITVGDGANIGPKALVTQDIPAGHSVIRRPDNLNKNQNKKRAKDKKERA